MFLHKILLNSQSREARRDLANPYELHSTLCRAFSSPEQKCPPGAFLWRLEKNKDIQHCPEVLIQSDLNPDWSKINVKDWFVKEPSKPLDLESKLSLETLQLGQRFRFRLRANPSVCRSGKRQGLMYNNDQQKWIVNKGLQHGFELPQLLTYSLEETSEVEVLISEEQMLIGKQRSGNEIRIYSVQFDGILTVKDVEKFRLALQKGIGHGKTMGLGLLSVVPIK